VTHARYNGAIAGTIEPGTSAEAIGEGGGGGADGSLTIAGLAARAKAAAPAHSLPHRHRHVWSPAEVVCKGRRRGCSVQHYLGLTLHPDVSKLDARRSLEFGAGTTGSGRQRQAGAAR